MHLLGLSLPIIVIVFVPIIKYCLKYSTIYNVPFLGIAVTFGTAMFLEYADF